MNNNLVSGDKSIKYDKIAAIIVTYNRLELLKKVIAGLQAQTRKLDKIYVINNSSTDGTSEWLSEQTDIETITQPNVGSSGGQYTGSMVAFDAGYEWIWQMDDDVVADAECLQNLFKHCNSDFVCVPTRMDVSGKIFYNDTKEVNMSHPFRHIWKSIISKKDFETEDELIYAEGITLEGPIFHRSMFERIGFVEKNFFILGDDTEFCIRLKNIGVKKAIVRSAIFFRQLPVIDVKDGINWKTYYYIRNLIAIDVLHGTFSVRWIRPYGYLIKWIFRCGNINELKLMLKAFRDGYFYKSENPIFMNKCS